MTTNITITLNLVNPYTFNQTAFTGTISYNGTNTNVTFNTSVNSTTATATTNIDVPLGESTTFTVSFNEINNPPKSGGSSIPQPVKPFPNTTNIGTFTLNFNNTTPPSTTSPSNLNYTSTGPITGTVNGTVTAYVSCLHGSSLIETKNGCKRLDQICVNDEVLSDGQYVKVKQVVMCWLTFMGVDHDAIIFESGSLGDNIPNKQLIIDPGHPICTPQEYLEKGYEALKPAGSYWEQFKGDKVYTKKWTDTFVQNQPSVRYDLILEEPHNTYIANNIIVRARGYENHRYKRFV